MWVWACLLGGGVGSDFAFHLLQKEKGEESPFNFSIKLINLRIMLYLFFLHTLLLIGMADVMPRFGRKCLLKQFASLQGARARSSRLRSQRHSGTGVVGGLGG